MVKIALSIWEQNTGLRKMNMTFEEGGGVIKRWDVTDINRTNFMSFKFLVVLYFIGQAF